MAEPILFLLQLQSSFDRTLAQKILFGQSFITLRIHISSQKKDVVKEQIILVLVATIAILVLLYKPSTDTLTGKAYTTQNAVPEFFKSASTHNTPEQLAIINEWKQATKK